MGLHNKDRGGSNGGCLAVGLVIFGVILALYVLTTIGIIKF